MPPRTKAPTARATDEIDLAISGLRQERAEQGGARRRSGVVPISDQVREVSRGTAEAYEALRRQMEEAVSTGRMVVEIDTRLIDDTSWRDRDDRGFADDAFLALRQSIAANGQITPAALRQGKDGRYEIVFGHRRVHACRALGRPVRAVIVTLDEQGLVAQMLIENAQRIDLSPLEKARHYRRLLKAGLFQRTELAALLGVTPQQVSNVAALADIPENVLEMLGDPRDLSIGVGKQLLAVLQRHGGSLSEADAEAMRALKGNATTRARHLIRLLGNGAQPTAGDKDGTLIRDRQGRRYGRLSRSGSQLVFRFQPGLDERVIRRLAARIPSLYAEVAEDEE
ncbi:plasmid partitioning protein RepB [Arboricoccus pini]|uniref:Plasmid partitioning protein RepB n=1 Tax=Arboricoccus pini TaxID=1963835 RepID=A0A212RYA1_9PROT|nr:ParB/RepB/Spo0J family partition protein [Arboricoccus pini]SNB77697.1 plasmid partitioning protein RepB [Arboricoccus pini]